MGTASPVVEAQQYFPGHQEFFFIFILSTDCYSFSVHLKNRLNSEINKLLTSSDTMKGIENRLLQLKLLSRFLGLLVFSPSWHDSGFVGGSRYDVLSDFNSELDITGIIERAHKERYLVTTIPWVIEFLRMARWSPTLQKSGNFKRLLALLLEIQHRIRCDEKEAPDSLCVNMQLVLLYLDTLFGGVIGLERSSTIPIAARTASITTSNGESKHPDECPLRFSNSFLFASNPHTEELFALLTSQTQAADKAKSHSSRKLTPYSVGSSVGSSADPLGSPSSVSFSPVKTKRRVSLGSDGDKAAQVGIEHQTSPVLGKLVEAFFHQHQDLKSICEFVVDQTLKNAATRMRVECIVPSLKQKSNRSLEQVMKESLEFLSTEVGNTIPAALAILCPPTIQPRVRDVAAKLSIAHAIRLGEATIDSLVRMESKKLSLEKARQSTKQASGSDTQRATSKTNHEDPFKVEDTLVALRNSLANYAWERRLDFMVTVVSDAKEAILRSENGSAVSIRGLYQALDLSSVLLLHWCLREACCEGMIRWKLVSDFLEVIMELCNKSNSSSPQEGFKFKIASYLEGEDPVDALIDLGLNVLSSDGDDAQIATMAQLLQDVTRNRLLRPAQLEMGLIRSLRVHEKGRVLCLYFAKHEDDCSNGSAAESEKRLDYARLRDELKKQKT